MVKLPIIIYLPLSNAKTKRIFSITFTLFHFKTQYDVKYFTKIVKENLSLFSSAVQRLTFLVYNSNLAKINKNFKKNPREFARKCVKV